MLHVILGTDREKARAAASNAALRTEANVTRITDANSLDDLRSTLTTNSSMFGESRAVILDSVCSNAEMRDLLLHSLPALGDSAGQFFILEAKPDAELKKKFLKHAQKVETFDMAKQKEYPTVFKLADHMKKGDKKGMWVAYQRELAQGNVPEAIHGVLFWGAKQLLLGARSEKEVERGRNLVANLAELPHESRRRGEELEYALERFILSSV
ncbi:MAG TPA: hypothetical protein VJG64_03575 [Candidatus Paceibacterota bacterium]